MTTFCPRCGTELAEWLGGTWFETPVTCEACALTLTDPPLVLAPGPADDEVEYSLADWSVPERATATSALGDVDIPYRWEPGLILVVPVVAEEEVDLLLEELGAVDEEDLAVSAAEDPADTLADVPDDLADDPVVTADTGDDTGDDADDDLDDDLDDDEADGGEEAQAAMADLFVAADRLQHAPTDEGVGEEFAALAEFVAASPPPYGIARPVWTRIRVLAAAVVDALEAGADEEAVGDGARAVRDFLRDLV